MCKIEEKRKVCTLHAYNIQHPLQYALYKYKAIHHSKAFAIAGTKVVQECGEEVQ